MTSPLEEQVLGLQQKLETSKSFRLLAEFLANAVGTHRPLLNASSDKEVLIATALELSAIASQRAEAIETGKHVQDLSLTIDEIKLLKAMIAAFSKRHGWNLFDGSIGEGKTEI